MMDDRQIASRVQQALSQVLDVPAASVGPGVSATTSPAWTSLNHLMMVSQLENEVWLVFTKQEFRELTSYDSILTTVVERLAPGT